jgi:hypothetical protein
LVSNSTLPNNTDCAGVYSVHIPPNTLTRVGYYQFDLVNNGVDESGFGFMKISIRKTLMSAGAVNLEQTLLVAP